MSRPHPARVNVLAPEAYKRALTNPAERLDRAAGTGLRWLRERGLVALNEGLALFVPVRGATARTCALVG